MSVTPIDLGYIMGGVGEQGPAGRPPNAEEIKAAIALIGTDSEPTQGSQNLMTSGAIYNAFNTYTPNREFIELTNSITLANPPLNCELYYGNKGFEDRTLSIQLPKLAAEGSKFFLEFRSQGTQDVAAVIESFTVEEGGVLLKKGTLDPDAYVTRISATYSFGIWIAQIITFDASGEIPASQAGSIIYDGSNYAYFAALAESSISSSVTVGPNKLENAINMTPNWSAYNFGNLYGMTFDRWTTNPDGTGNSYADGAEIEIPSQTPVTLYPQYIPTVFTRVDPNETDFAASEYEYRTGTISSPLNYDLKTTLDINSYKELRLDVRVRIHINAHTSGETGYVYMRGDETNTLLYSVRGKTTGTLKASEWLTLHRASAEDDFVLPLRFSMSGGNHSFLVHVIQRRYGWEASP